MSILTESYRAYRDGIETILTSLGVKHVPISTSQKKSISEGVAQAGNSQKSTVEKIKAVDTLATSILTMVQSLEQRDPEFYQYLHDYLEEISYHFKADMAGVVEKSFTVQYVKSEIQAKKQFLYQSFAAQTPEFHSFLAKLRQGNRSGEFLRVIRNTTDTNDIQTVLKEKFPDTSIEVMRFIIEMLHNQSFLQALTINASLESLEMQSQKFAEPKVRTIQANDDLYTVGMTFEPFVNSEDPRSIKTLQVQQDAIKVQLSKGKHTEQEIQFLTQKMEALQEKISLRKLETQRSLALPIISQAIAVGEKIEEDRGGRITKNYHEASKRFDYAHIALLGGSARDEVIAEEQRIEIERMDGHQIIYDGNYGIDEEGNVHVPKFISVDKLHTKTPLTLTFHARMHRFDENGQLVRVKRGEFRHIEELYADKVRWSKLIPSLKKMKPKQLDETIKKGNAEGIIEMEKSFNTRIGICDSSAGKRTDQVIRRLASRIMINKK